MWFPLEVVDAWLWIGLPFPVMKWVGLQKIMVWLLTMPLSVTLFIFGVAIFLVGMKISNSYNRRRIKIETARGASRGR